MLESVGWRLAAFSRVVIGLDSPALPCQAIGQSKSEIVGRPMMVRLELGVKNTSGAHMFKLPSSRKTKRVSTIKLPKIFRRHNRCRAIQTDCENACASKYADVETQGYQILVIFFQLEIYILYIFFGRIFYTYDYFNFKRNYSTSHFES